jgi:hypothetical protein
MASKYYEFDRAYDDKVETVYLDTISTFPIPNYWRNDPLSEKSYIRSNVAGYYPYPTQMVKSTQKQNNDWQYTWQAVCSTIVPNNPQYKKKREPIMFR